MATSATHTVKISQTILLDIDISQIESVRIVDVDLLILLKDGQRLIVPEGAVRAMMDNDFSINFKGRVFSVTSLMELKTLKSQPMSEMGIASKPVLPAITATPGSTDAQRLDLSGDSGVTETSQQPAPVQPSTDATAQARHNASALDRQAETAAPALASPGPLGTDSTTPSALTASADSPSVPVAAGISSIWKYAVGALGAGLVAVASRAGAKAASAVADSSATLGETTLSGVLALGPFKEGTQLKLVVSGVDAAGKTVVMANTVIRSDASSKYSITLEGAYKHYVGPILVELSDADPTTSDFKSEATGAEVALGTLTLRAVEYQSASGAMTLNITPLTELAVRSALGSQQGSEGTVLPTQDAITAANTHVAQAFGLGKDVMVTTASVKTVFDTGFNPADTSVGTKYALALAALSGVDSLQTLGTGQTAADQTVNTLAKFAAPFVDASAASVATPTALSQELIDLLIRGSLAAQPTVQTLSQASALNMPALVAKQIVESYASSNTSKILALVGSSVTTLGTKGALLEFHFDQPISNLSLSDVVITPSTFTLQSIRQTDDKGMSWSAMLVPSTTTTIAGSDVGTVQISFAPSQWVGNTWKWSVDTTPPPVPTALTLAPTNSQSQVTDSGISATDHLSNVRTPAVRVALNTQDSVAGDTLVLRQLGSAADELALNSLKQPRNDWSRVLSASDIGTGWVDFSLNDLGPDGTYRFAVYQQDAAGNVSSTVYTPYMLDTVAPGAVKLTNVSASGLIDFGNQTPLGLVNARTKAAGFMLEGVGGEPDCTISVTWGGKIVRQGVQVNDDGTWSVLLTSANVPADNKNTRLIIAQVDAAGNVSAETSYTVEVNAAGVSAKVVSISVGDDSAAVSAGGYSTNAHDVLNVGQSTDDTTPVVSVKLDRQLYANEIIQVYDTAQAGSPQALFTLSGTPVKVNGDYVWTSSADQWANTAALTAGSHVLSAQVLNTYTLDAGDELLPADRPAFVVQALNFNQLLLSADPSTNLIPANQSAGAVTLDNIAVNKPVLGGTLATALGAGERLAVYDVYQGQEQYLGTAVLTAVKDSANRPTGAFTWRFAFTTPMANGSHSLSVRVESDSAKPVIRLAMTQDLSVSLPILSIAPAAVSPNGVSTDTGWSSTDNISSNKTPMFRLVFPAMGRKAGDIVSLADVNTLDANKNPTVVYTYTLTAKDLTQGYADFATTSLLPSAANATSAKTLGLIVSIKGTAANSLAIKSVDPLVYVLDTVPPPAPVLSLVTDTSYDPVGKKSYYITRVPTLAINDYDNQQYKLQTQLKKNGISPTASAWQDGSTLPSLLTDGTQDGTWTVFARLVDVAGNISAVSTVDKLGPGTGYFSFTLDTKAPTALPLPTLLDDTTNNTNASFASDRITSNFHLRDAVPATLEAYSSLQSTAKLEYRVWLDGKAIPVQWSGSYLEAMGVANDLAGDALVSWMGLDGQDDLALTAMLSEGVYHVQRRQTDMAGNVSNETADWTFTLDYKLSPLSIGLVNDTSINRRVTSDVSIQLKRQGVLVSSDSDPGSKWLYELTGYTDAIHSATNGISTSSSVYVAPTVDGYYTLKVTQTNKANVISESSLIFQRDTIAPGVPGSISLWPGSDTHRGVLPDMVGVGDNVSSVINPTFVVRLPSGNATATTPKAGDRLELYRLDPADATASPALWGSQVLTQSDLDNLAQEVKVLASSLETDQVYTFKTRWVDVAGNVSDWGPSVTYRLDTQALAPAINDIQLPGLPRNFINQQSSVRFSGTGEPGSLLTLHWAGKDHTTSVDQNGGWELTLDRADFDANTARLAYDSTVTVSLVDAAGNQSLSSTLQLAVNAAPESILAVIDRVSGTSATGLIGNGHTTGEHLPLLSGHLSDALPVAQRSDLSDQPVVQVYDGSTLLGVASVIGTEWTYQVTQKLAEGLHNFQVSVYDPLTLQTGVSSTPYSIYSNTLSLDALDAAHPSHWIIQNTSTPTLTGTLKTSLAPNESLAVYDSLADGSYKYLGTVDASTWVTTTAGLFWSFDMPFAMFGEHTYRIQVETANGTALMTLDQSVQYDFNSITLSTASDSGSSPDDSISRVKAPTVVIHLASHAVAGAVVKLTLEGSPISGAAYQHIVNEQDLAAGQFSMALPDLWSQIGSNGLPKGDSTYHLGATVDGAPVVSDVAYQLDTTSPTYAPSVSLQNPTGGITGYTADFSLRVASPINGKSAGDIEEVQVMTAAGVEVVGWTPIANFNLGKRSDSSHFTLSDGSYIVHTRATDLAGNIGPSGNDVNLNFDTQAALVSHVEPWVSAALEQLLQQDGQLSKAETAPGAQFQFKLSFNEPVSGLTVNNLALEVSGAGATRPILDSVTAIDPSNGYASDWLVTVTHLDQLVSGETLKLKVSNGLGVLDQALNHNDNLSYINAQVLTTDLDAGLSITAAISGSQTLLASPNATSMTFNAAAIRNGVQVSGTTTSVEAGQVVSVTLVDAAGQTVYNVSSVPVGSDGSWSAQLNQMEASSGLAVLADQSQYTLRASVHDVSGNPAQATLDVLTRLVTTISINQVIANNPANTQVMDFVSSSPDAYVTSADKSAGQVGSAAVAGFTVSGDTTIQAGGQVNVQLVRDGVTPVVVVGTVDNNHHWNVRFTGNQVKNLAEGGWQWVASGTDIFGNTATNSERIRSFTVDTQYSVSLDPVSSDSRVNLSDDGSSLVVSGSFANIETSHTLSLSLRDVASSTPSQVVWSQNDIALTAVDSTTGTWRYEVPLAQWDALLQAGALTRDANGVASLAFTATAMDTAGNVASNYAAFTLDRTPPAAPVLDPAAWQVVGDTAFVQSPTRLSRATTLAVDTQGVVLGQQAHIPADRDIASITVNATSIQPMTDQWRLGSAVWSMNASVANNSLTLDSGAAAFTVTYGYDATSRQLTVQMASGAVFTPEQVQRVLNQMAWVNAATDGALEQTDRVFTLHYTDAYGNVSDSSTVSFAVDTQAPLTLNHVALTTAVTGTVNDGSVVSNTLNGTNTAIKFSANIGAGEAAGGYAEFYVGLAKIGTSQPIGETDTTVSYTTESNGAVTTTAAELQSHIAAGGLVSVKLFDRFGNMLSANGPMLTRDVTPPTIVQIDSSSPDGLYKAGATIALSLLTDEDIAGDGSTLDVTLATGSADPAGVPDRVVTLTRDVANHKLFTGSYTVQPGDNTVDLNVSQVALSSVMGAVPPQDAAGNALNLSIASLVAANTLSGSHDMVIDTTSPVAIDLVSGGVVNITQSQYVSAAMAGIDTDVMAAVDRVSDHDVSVITLAVLGADGLNDVLTFGGVSMPLNATARSGTVSAGSVMADWAYSAAGVLTFTLPGGGAWNPADIQALESSLKFKTYQTAQMGVRRFTLTHGDQAGNTSVASTQSLIVDMLAPSAPDLDALNAGIQRTSTTYYGSADVGGNKVIAPKADASQDDIAQIVITVGGVVSSADQWVMGSVTQSLNPNASANGSNLSINGVSGVDWAYNTGKVLTLTRNGGGTWTAAQVRDIERGLSFNTTAGAPTGARTFTLQNIDAAGNASAASSVTLMSDVTAPTVTAAAITGVTPAGAPKSILGVGDQVRVELTLSEGVVVDTSLGIPSYRVMLDTGGTVSATYVSGSGTNTLVFSYTVAPTNSDSIGGIVPAASPLNLNGATVLDLAGNACSIASLPLPAVNTLRVDTAAPASVSSMTVLDTNIPASTNGTVKVLNSSLFQLMSARGVHYGFNNTSAVTISYRQDDGSSLSFSFTDSTTYTSLGGIKTAATTAFTNSTLGQAGLFDFSIDGASGNGFSSNSSSSPPSSGDGVTRMMWMYLQAKPGKLVDASKLTFSNSFYYWLPSNASANNPGATAVTYDTAVGWGSNTPAVPGNASVNTGQGMSTTQIAVGGHINSGSTSANGWLYQYQGLTRSTPTTEPVVDTVADNRLVFDFSAAGGIAKSTVLSTVTAGEGRLNAADALTVLNLWRSKFTPASGALPTFVELFGSATTYNVTAQEITSTGGEGFMVSYQYLTGSSSLVGKVTIDLGASSTKSKLLGGKFTFGSGLTATVLKLPTAWANDGGTQINAVPTFDITLPTGVEEGSVISLYDGTTSSGTMIGTKFLTANEVTRGFASLAVSPDTPFANTSSGVVVHSLSAKVTDNAGNVSTNDSFYNYAFQDSTGPKVRAVKVWGATAAGTAKTSPLVAGDQVKVTLVWDETPVVTGVPTYSLNINGVTQTATYQSTSGKEMLLSYTVGATDSAVGVTATTTALTLANGATIQDASGNAASLTAPVVAAIDSPVILANPRGEVNAEQAQALATGESQPAFALSYDGSRAQVGDRLVLMENGVSVGSRVLTSSDVGAGSHTLNVNTDSSLVSGTHAITFQYLDNTGAGTTYTVNGAPVTEYVSVGAHPSAPVLTLDAIRLNNEGGQAGRTVSDWSTYQSTSDPDLVFGGTVDQDATVTVYATSNTTGAVQTVGTQSVLANGTFTISEIAFSLSPDVYQFKVVAQNTAGQVASVSTGSVGVFATSTVGDTIVGTAGNDKINAGEGNNTVSTGSGLDLVYLGGYGVLASNTGPSSTTITDFKLGQDKIDLTGVFAPGTVNASNFMQFVSQSVSNGDTTLTIDNNGLSVAGGTVHTVILKNLAQLPLDSTVFNYPVL